MPNFEFNIYPLQLPEPFTQRIHHQFPHEADEFLSALQNTPAISIRFNNAKFSGLVNDPIPWCENATYLTDRPVFSLDPLFHAGAYYVQESSSMILGHILQSLRNTTQPWKVLDLCAAPGGKSTQLLQSLYPQDVLVSNEIIPMRNAILQENLAKWGYPNVLISRSDPAQFSKCTHTFDLIWVDAPCSGEGMFRKDPDTMKEWSPENLQNCHLRQNRIISDVWSALKPGGFMVYSTCTFNPDENENLIQNFLNETAAISIQISVSESWGILSAQKECVHYLQFLPHRTHGEGFFVVVLQKPGKVAEGSDIFKDTPVPKNVLPFISLLNPELGPYHWFFNEDELMAMTLHSYELFNRLKKYIYFTSPALNMGKVIRNELLPSQELAWNLAFNSESFTFVELKESDALEYLRKSSNLKFNCEKGWVLVKYKGVVLGWAKQLGNRINNYYPSNYRLRLQ